MDQQRESPRLINGAILVLVSLVLALASKFAADAYRDYASARTSVQVNYVADAIIRAAGAHALERGMTTAVLGDRTAVSLAHLENCALSATRLGLKAAASRNISLIPILPAATCATCSFRPTRPSASCSWLAARWMPRCGGNTGRSATRSGSTPLPASSPLARGCANRRRRSSMPRTRS